MRRKHRRPVRRHQKADRAEDALLTKYRQPDGDADGKQCPPCSECRARQMRKDAIAAELRHTQRDDDVEDEIDTVAERRPQSCTCSAEGRDAARAVHEDVIEYDVERHGRHGDEHG